MTELSFLLELLLNHRLTKPTKDLLQARIKEVESNLNSNPIPLQVNKIPTTIQPIKPNPNAQAPSTQAILDKEAGLTPQPLPKEENLPIATPRVVTPVELTRNMGNGSTLRGPRKF